MSEGKNAALRRVAALVGYHHLRRISPFRVQFHSDRDRRAFVMLSKSRRGRYMRPAHSTRGRFQLEAILLCVWLGDEGFTPAAQRYRREYTANRII